MTLIYIEILRHLITNCQIRIFIYSIMKIYLNINIYTRRITTKLYHTKITINKENISVFTKQFRQLTIERKFCVFFKGVIHRKLFNYCSVDCNKLHVAHNQTKNQKLRLHKTKQKYKKIP